jgi:hypothetical protein
MNTILSLVAIPVLYSTSPVLQSVMGYATFKLNVLFRLNTESTVFSLDIPYEIVLLFVFTLPMAIIQVLLVFIFGRIWSLLTYLNSFGASNSFGGFWYNVTTQIYTSCMLVLMKPSHCSRKRTTLFDLGSWHALRAF